ncbi:large ribosomal subunit protein uL10m [Anabrus simplex]|uniref:large ribosomal subunit protein uL10m n=1 Tax=Anabrus simplex TaxID=316456 RepID=UPI0035A34D43
MALLVQKAILEPHWQPCVQFLRFRNRINIQRPKKPHYERAKVLHVCRPFFAKLEKTSPVVDVCLRPIEVTKKKDEVENPFRTLLARDLLNWFNHSQMVLFYHENPIKSDDLFKARILFKRQNMCLRSYSRNIARPALEGTKYEAVLELFNSPVAMAFSPEPQVSKALKITKKIPQLILLAGIVEDRLLSKNEIVEYSRLPDLQTSRAQLVATLNSAASHLVQNLNHHQLTLVSQLQQYIELQTSKDTVESQTPVDKLDSQSLEVKTDSTIPKGDS